MEKAIDKVVKEETEKMLQTPGGCSVHTESQIDEEEGMATYFIHFYPGQEVIKNGNNLFYLLEDLQNLGQMSAMPGVLAIPPFQNFDPSKSYLFWDIFLATEKGINAIKDVFIFVEDEATLEVHRISRSNLFDAPGFKAKINELSERQRKIDLSEVTGFARSQTSSLPSELPGTDNQDMPDEMMEGVSQKQESKNSSGGAGNGSGRTSSSIRVATEKIDELMNLVSEMVITQERLNMIAGQHHIPELKLVSETVQKLTAQLRDSTFSISLIPIETLLMRFQRLIHDLGNNFNKKINLQTEGLDTELDKTMIESLTDPLLHILRNSIDHGIETPQIRQKSGKPEEGTIKLRAFYSGANVVIEISDDGAGIDTQKVYDKAVENGVVAPDIPLSEQEILNLVFRSGFSTNSKVTEVSGRGVGMDVVMQNIMAIRGNVNLTSERGKGTTIRITLPLVLSIIDGLLVKIDQTQYVIPLSLTDRIFPVRASDVEKAFNNMISLGGKQLPFYNLREELNLDGKAPEKMQMVVINYRETRVALTVDQVVGKLQAVLKPLGKLYHDQKLISAATIMGDGSIALILDVNALVDEYSRNNH
jgi:two-component system chemotaxis sensor kinase CheA